MNAERPSSAPSISPATGRFALTAFVCQSGCMAGSYRSSLLPECAEYAVVVAGVKGSFSAFFSRRCQQKLVRPRSSVCALAAAAEPNETRVASLEAQPFVRTLPVRDSPSLVLTTPDGLSLACPGALCCPSLCPVKRSPVLRRSVAVGTVCSVVSLSGNGAGVGRSISLPPRHRL